jgi:L-aspartate oxidase
MPLVSEAVRGEGAVLIDETGTRFMAGQGRAELEPRDSRLARRRRRTSRPAIVSSSMPGRRCARTSRSFSPASPARCRAAGIDPVRQPIPVRPAVHYHMGGIAVDAEGRSTVEGLWACGEVAASGLHGANRLASNSLLEAVVMASAVADSIVGTEPAPLPAARPVALPPAPDVSGPARPDQREAGRRARPCRPRAGGRPSAAARLQGRRCGRSGARRP